MGRLIDEDDLIADLEIQTADKISTKERVIGIIKKAPAIKAYPERPAQIERRKFGKDSASYVCNACENAIPDHVIPDTIRYCWKCGARITGVRYATK